MSNKLEYREPIRTDIQNRASGVKPEDARRLNDGWREKQPNSGTSVNAESKVSQHPVADNNGRSADHGDTRNHHGKKHPKDAQRRLEGSTVKESARRRDGPKWHANFDSTLGYPGEGPPRGRGGPDRAPGPDE
jgi:hypothetical protein